MRRRRVRAALSAGVALLAAVTAARPAAAQCLVDCNFSISGKKGRFLDKQVTPAALAGADAATTAGLTDGRSLDASSINKGGNAGTGLNMPQTEAAMMALLARIRAAWPYRQPGPVAVRMLGTTIYSPTAKPDNVIVVPVGLLIAAKNDDEVAWVMAHEFSHIALAHFSREARQRRLTAGLDQIVACTRVGMAMTELRPRVAGEQVRFDTVEDKSLRALSAQVLSRSNLMGDALEVYNQQLSKKQEDEADAAGFDLAAKAKYSDSGYGDALAAVQAEEARSGSLLGAMARDFGTYVVKSAGQSAADLVKGGRIGDVAAKFGGGAVKNGAQLAADRGLEIMKQSHRPAPKRIEGLAKYFDDGKYDKDVFPGATATWLAAVRATPEFAEARTAAVARDGALQALNFAPGDPKDPAFIARAQAGVARALQLIDAAKATRYAAAPPIANVVARVNAAAGNDREADRLYDLADAAGATGSAPPAAPIRRAPPGRRGAAAAPPAPVVAAAGPTRDPYLQQSLDGFAEHADFLIGRRNYAKALSVVQLAKARFGDDQRYLPQLVTIYTQTRRQPELLDAVARCGATQDRVLREQCTMAFASPAQQAQISQLSPEQQAALVGKLNQAAGNARTMSTCGLTNAAARIGKS